MSSPNPQFSREFANPFEKKTLVSTDSTRFLSVLNIRTTDGIGRVQVATKVARVNIWTIT
jgi:hypothetical protein